MLPQPMKARFRVERMGAPGAADRLIASLRSHPGVVRIRLDAIPPAAAPTTTASVTVTYRAGETSPQDLLAVILAAGFTRAQIL